MKSKLAICALLGIITAGCGCKENSSCASFTENKQTVNEALIGVALDEQDRKVLSQISPRTIERMDMGQELSINDIIKLAEAGISDETNIRYLKQTKAVYKINQTQINRMQQSGVSQRVIKYLIETNE